MAVNASAKTIAMLEDSNRMIAKIEACYQFVKPLPLGKNLI
jgi:hypothetical protein